MTIEQFAPKLAALGSLMASDAIRKFFKVFHALDAHPELVDTLRNPTSLKGCTLPLESGKDVHLSLSEMAHYVELWDAGCRRVHLLGLDLNRLLWPERFL